MRVSLITLSVLAALSVSNAHALDYKFNGFASIVGATVLSGGGGSDEFPNERECPCYIADWNTGATYEDGDTGLNFKPDTKVGGQINLSFSDSFSLVSQAVARAYTNEVNIEWLYLSLDLNANWVLQAGRKRIPLYFYSEFQDVGLTFPWARPAQDLYGWEASNYNGVSLQYSSSFDALSVRASVYGGKEEVTNAGYNSFYYEDDQDSLWDNIRGGDIETSYEWFTGRLTYMESENSITDFPFSGKFSEPPMEQSVTGLALNADFVNWFVMSEYNLNAREFVDDGLKVEGVASMFGVGWRLADWTPFVSGTEYWETANQDSYANERHLNWSATLRYDLDESKALKVQYELVKDKSQYEFIGDTNLITVAFDLVF